MEQDEDRPDDAVIRAELAELAADLDRVSTIVADQERESILQRLSHVADLFLASPRTEP